MKLTILSPAKALSKAYLKQSLKREQIDLFKSSLARLFQRIKEGESEEHLKNIVADFLKDAWYKPAYEINTSGRADLVIHNGRSSSDSVGVIIEVKRPSNTTEMISSERPNVKALHELLHYYLQERYLRDNKEIKQLIICNIYEWYIFDAADFERLFFGNPKFVKNYRDWTEGTLPGTGTDWFYQELAKPFIREKIDELTCTCFNLKEYERLVRSAVSSPQSGGDDRKLINLYKLLSPPHLLKLPFANDSNSLNREFYSELLHIIGLEEVKDKGKKLIRRKASERRNDGSLLENTISVLVSQRVLENLENLDRFGADEEERLFSIGLELCITWLDRVLFLKLLEGQLIAHHRGDRSRAFLNSRMIEGFDGLQELFFEVLAVRPDRRNAQVNARYGAIPYLNSSLFEPGDLERKTVHISSLKERKELPLHGATVLKGSNGKRLTGNKGVLPYLFEFLDAYDFAAEGNAEIQEENKNIINAAVLGLIFEKINGYKDGSFFTPGFITMYICRETIRRGVVAKFRGSDIPGLAKVTDFADLKDRLDWTDRDLRKKSNDIINSLRLCDPAVGSGHFLVSALNEIIAIKSELGVLCYRDNGDRVKEYRVTVDQDELIVIDKDDDKLFEYVLNRNGRPDEEQQRIQETLFHEKQTIIEQCLFGVDINPKSVSICRLRLWIELLKSAYYRASPTGGVSELETLPNIDINIKCGNSLVSRFSLRDDKETLERYAPAERQKLRNLTTRYREKVWAYKLGSDGPSNKAVLRREIQRLKEQWSSFSDPADGYMRELRRINNELAQEIFVFDNTGLTRRQVLHQKAEELEQKIEERQRTVYANAFEWRFEFPEVLDDDGRFVGFDMVIGNPPYIRHEAIKAQKEIYAERFGDFFCGTADLYTYFFKAGLEILKPKGSLCYIAPNKFMRAGYGRKTRELLTTRSTPLLILDFGDLSIFDEATTYPSIVLVENAPPQTFPVKGRKINSPPQRGEIGKEKILVATFTDPEQLKNLADTVAAVGFTMPLTSLSPTGWTLERPDVLELMAKLRKVGKPLGEYVDEKFYRGVLTGLNEAFVIDEETRQRLIAEDPNCAEIIKPWLRGRDIRKWKTVWAGLYLITIPSSGNHDWPWSNAAHEDAQALFANTYPSVHQHFLPFVEQLKKRDDQGRFWWELRACSYYDEFDREKISYPHFSTAPVFALDEDRRLSNDKSYIIPTSSRFLLGFLNSKVTQFFLTQLSPPVRGGFLELRKIFLEQLPIPPATDEQKAAIEELVQKIVGANGVRPDSDTMSTAGVCHTPLQETVRTLSGVEGDIPALEAEIDRLVYALYCLTDDEIAVVEEKKLP